MPTDIALGIVTFLMAALGGVVSAHAPTKLWVKLVYITAFLALGIVGGSYIVKQSRETAAAEHEAQVAQVKLANSIDNLSKSAEESQRIAQLNTALQERLLSSSATIAKLATNAVNVTTGGNSFCYVSPLRNVTGFFMAFHHGEYPLYGVQGRVLDLIAYEKLTEQEQLRIPTGGNLTVGDVSPKSSKQITFPFALPSGDQGYYRIFFSSSRNGFWTQDLMLKKVNGEWITAIKVWRKLANGKPVDVMKPLIPKDFSGPVNWKK